LHKREADGGVRRVGCVRLNDEAGDDGKNDNLKTQQRRDARGFGMFERDEEGELAGEVEKAGVGDGGEDVENVGECAVPDEGEQEEREDAHPEMAKDEELAAGAGGTFLDVVARGEIAERLAERREESGDDAESHKSNTDRMTKFE